MSILKVILPIEQAAAKIVNGRLEICLLTGSTESTAFQSDFILKM